MSPIEALVAIEHRWNLELNDTSYVHVDGENVIAYVFFLGEPWRMTRSGSSWRPESLGCGEDEEEAPPLIEYVEEHAFRTGHAFHIVPSLRRQE